MPTSSSTASSRAVKPMSISKTCASHCYGLVSRNVAEAAIFGKRVAAIRSSRSGMVPRPRLTRLVSCPSCCATIFRPTPRMTELRRCQTKGEQPLATRHSVQGAYKHSAGNRTCAARCARYPGRTARYDCEIVLHWRRADRLYIAQVPVLPGCRAHGTTEEEALSNFNQAIRYGSRQRQVRQSHTQAATTAADGGLGSNRVLHRHDLRHWHGHG